MSPFTRSAVLPDDELEARIRATLRRHADGIEPTQPPWSELVAQAGAVVLPLHGTELPAAHLRHRRGPRFSGPWLRPTMAAAVALLIAMSAAIVVQGRGDGGGAPADGGENGNGEVTASRIPDSPVIPSPGNTEFNGAVATAMPFLAYADEGVVWMGDPINVAQDYLHAVELDAHGPDLVTNPEPTYEIVATEGGDVETASLWWSVRDPEDFNIVRSQGAVFMRRDETDPADWVLVGTFTKSMVGLNGVRRADGWLSFTVNDFLEDPAVRIRIDGRVVGVEDLGRDGTRTYSFEDPAPGEVITLEIQHMDGDVPTTITAMALAPAGEEQDVAARELEANRQELDKSTETVPVSR